MLLGGMETGRWGWAGVWGVGLVTTLKGFSLWLRGAEAENPASKGVRTPGTGAGHREDRGSPGGAQ